MAKIKIAIDLMGGDKAPYSAIEGVRIAKEKYSNVDFILVGNKEIVKSVDSQFPFEEYEFIHTEKFISSEEKPGIALRNSKDTSMRLAIEQVKEKKANACLSAGNTGALMAISKYVLGTIEGVNRPAICSFVPSSEEPTVLLDMGANIECKPEDLLQFAAMGTAFYEATISKPKPTISLVNIGTEDIKGSQLIKEANTLIEQSDLKDQYTGYIEPNRIFFSKSNIVVADGFTGNIIIKTAEGFGKLILKNVVEKTFKNSFLTKLCYLLCAKTLKSNIKVVDPNRFNGAMFVGLGGISVKSHGNADEDGFSYAIDIAVSLARMNVNKKITEKITQLSKQRQN